MYWWASIPLIMLQESSCRDLGLSRQFVIGTQTNFLAPKLSLSEKYKVSLLCYVELLVSVFFQQSHVKATRSRCNAPHSVVSIREIQTLILFPSHCGALQSWAIGDGPDHVHENLVKFEHNCQALHRCCELMLISQHVLDPFMRIINSWIVSLLVKVGGL